MKRGKSLSRTPDEITRLNFLSDSKPPYIFDGAMGSYLQQSGINPDPKLWFSHLNVTNPEAVIKVHRAYIEAGADVITTNTFRTNPETASGSGFTSPELVKKAVSLAKTAADGKRVFIAGSNPPAEDSYQRERTLSPGILKTNHEKHIQLLTENGCDFILNETQGHLDEILIICEICASNKIPFIISLFFDSKFKILSGENIIDILKTIKEYKPMAIGFNCISISTFRYFLSNFNMDYPWGFYLNYGLGNITDREITNSQEPGSELDIIQSGLSKKVKFIGGCCGSGPEHIKYFKNIIYGNYNP